MPTPNTIWYFEFIQNCGKLMDYTTFIFFFFDKSNLIPKEFIRNFPESF